MRRQLRMALVVLVAPAVAMAGAAAVSATAAVPMIAEAAVSADDPAVRAMVAERGVDVSLARQAIAAQARAAELVEPLATSMGGPAFGGLWIGADDRVKVGVVGGVGGKAAPVAAALRLTSAYGLGSWTDTVPVRHSLAQLEAASDWLGAQVVRANKGADAGLLSALNVAENAVELRMPRHGRLTAAQHDLVTEATSRFGGMLQITHYTGRITANSCGLAVCSPPLRGGIAIGAGGSPCTSGFIAKSPRDPDRKFVITAGHCEVGAEGLTWVLQTDTSLRAIGRMPRAVFDERGDAGIIRITNTDFWKPKPWVYVAASDDTTLDKQYDIRRDGRSVQGMRICSTGSRSGTRCGRVTKLGVTVPYSTPRKESVRGMGEVDFCMARGDSGGPFFASHTAYGLDGASHTSCRTTGRGHTFYQGIRSAENLLNVDVIFS